MSSLLYIIWTVSPEIFSISGFSYSPRWYGLLFAGGFIVSQLLVTYIFNKEKRPKKDVDIFISYALIATIVGARLGHCFFYEPQYFFANPLEILMIWKGGLASHGATLGILYAVYLCCKRLKYHYFWMVDRAVIAIAIAAALIRIGNFMNSEMEGTLTHSNTGVVYARTCYEILNFDKKSIENVFIEKGGELVSNEAGIVPITAIITFKKGIKLSPEDKYFIENNLYKTLNTYSEVVEHVDFGKEGLKYLVDTHRGRSILKIFALGKVRHVAQLYETFYCLLIAIILFFIWSKKRATVPRGFNFALFFILLWSCRFMDEFFKMNQESFEEGMLFNMGQILSIPMFLFGAILMIYIYKGSKKMVDVD